MVAPCCIIKGVLAVAGYSGIGGTATYLSNPYVHLTAIAASVLPVGYFIYSGKVKPLHGALMISAELAVDAALSYKDVILQYISGHDHNEDNHYSDKNEFLDIKYLSPTSYYKEHKWIKPSACMTGRNGEGDILIADTYGSEVFGKGGPDIMHGNNGPDIFYFSMCSTKVINNQTALIENFGKEDKIRLFCTQKKLSRDDVSIKHDEVRDIYFVLIAGQFEPTAIAIEGAEEPITIEQHIKLNVPFNQATCMGETIII